MKQSVIALITLALLAPSITLAQSERSYHYSLISEAFTVNQDTTVDVEEAQTYAFSGEYHQGERVIPHKAVDAIAHISIVDSATGQSLVQVSRALDKTNPSSWGKFYVHEDGGKTYIDWYYNQPGGQATHTWVLHYTLHGAVAFYKDHDELYWNLFTDYTVPVDHVEATIRLPGDVTAPSASFYTTNKNEYTSTRPDVRTFFFTTAGIGAGESVTFAVGWQKGLVDQSAYWRDFFRMYWPIGAGFIILLIAIAFSLYYWWRQERRYAGRGVVVAEYEPPKGLPPAMAEIIAKGRTSSKTWAATVVDLAVRGFITVTKEEHTTFFFKSGNYVLTKTTKDISSLRPFEAEFYSALFARGESFSFADAKNDISGSQKLYGALQKTGKHVLEQIEEEQHIYINPPTRARYWWRWFHILWVVGFFGIFVFSNIVNAASLSNAVLFGSFVISALLVIYMLKICPWLNRDGHMLKEDILGFKLFLSITGKDRMQNLTPDMFEKYLPYAMIFGVEEEWAKNFDAFNLPPPSWYSGTGIYAISSGGSSFSPSGFATGFSASFASSFASSGGSGASGGGGGAGGGGGGGGGGAS